MQQTMVSDIHFACTGCGKCCDAPPTFTIAEALELYRDFILTVRLAGPIADARLPSSHPAVIAYRMQRTHLQAHGALGFQLDVEGGRSFEATLQIYAGGLRPGNDDPCPMLREDNLCGIYERRPQKCRTVPFDYWLAEPIAVATAGERLVAALQRGWQCDVSAAAPVVAAGGVLTEGPYGDAYRQALSLMDRQEPALALVAEAFTSELKAKPAMVAPVVDALGQGQAVDYNFLMVLDGLLRFRAARDDETDLHRDKLPRHPASDALFAALPPRDAFLRAQLPLIDAAITKNLARKRSVDRPNTERLRALKSLYEAQLHA